MKKAQVIINLLPFAIWMLWFVCQLTDIFAPSDYAIIQLCLLIITPIIFSVCNTIFAGDKRSLINLNATFSAADIIGYYLSGVLYHSFVSNDTETALVVNTFTLFLVFYTVVITAICLVVKLLLDKSKHKQNDRG